MTAATVERTDLSWVTFSSDEADACCSCASEAVAVAVFSGRCNCHGHSDPGRHPMCVQCRRDMAALVAEEGPHLSCANCQAPLYFLRFEPIR